VIPGSPALLGLSPLEWQEPTLVLVDQTALPDSLLTLRITSCESLVQAIRALKVRGAPALGLAGAWGVALACRELSPGPGYRSEVAALARKVAAARPTAVNLSWAVERVLACLEEEPDGTLWPRLAVEEARLIQDEDRRACQAICNHALDWIGEGTWMTLCNAGPLATSGIGTALGALIHAHRQGKAVSVLACETRPLLQGARLTIWELQQAGVPCRLITDGMAATAMDRLGVRGVIIGADRIAGNGDTANKVGSYSLALAARFHQIPCLVAAPESTRDARCPTGSDIPIEERDAAEVRGFAPFDAPALRWAPEHCDCWNPAFDVVPADLITAIITENGATRPGRTPGKGPDHEG
jgi:methylthioribose-1-phosphate isomerase